MGNTGKAIRGYLLWVRFHAKTTVFGPAYIKCICISSKHFTTSRRGWLALLLNSLRISSREKTSYYKDGTHYTFLINTYSSSLFTLLAHNFNLVVLSFL